MVTRLLLCAWLVSDHCHRCSSTNDPAACFCACSVASSCYRLAFCPRLPVLGALVINYHLGPDFI